MKSLLDGKCVAILVADGFEQSELEGPYDALFEAGATVDIVSQNQDTVKAWAEKNYGATFKVDTPAQRGRSGRLRCVGFTGRRDEP